VPAPQPQSEEDCHVRSRPPPSRPRPDRRGRGDEAGTARGGTTRRARRARRDRNAETSRSGSRPGAAGPRLRIASISRPSTGPGRGANEVPCHAPWWTSTGGCGAVSVCLRTQLHGGCHDLRDVPKLRRRAALVEAETSREGTRAVGDKLMARCTAWVGCRSSRGRRRWRVVGPAPDRGLPGALAAPDGAEGVTIVTPSRLHGGAAKGPAGAGPPRWTLGRC
jgi:hypothetical protein